MSGDNAKEAIKNLQSGVIAVVGLGYVGLPIAAEFGKSRKVIGFDINTKRIDELRECVDTTGEMDSGELARSKYLSLTSDSVSVSEATVYIVTVPSPIDESKKPDLSCLLSASEIVGRSIKSGDTVIYESTVYPGCTEEDCIPVIERVSGLKFNRDFFAGYSPERINPGDKSRRLPDIVKVTSGSTPAIASAVDDLYRSIIKAGTHKAMSIRVAEAAKVIENTQRDLNISLVNELAIIFDKLDLDTEAVLEAAGTKWNFLPFRPGLVGGHCISVDPYYLTSKAEAVGYFPQVVLAGRRINDGMGAYVADRIIKKMIWKDIAIKASRALILGLAFKENCPDIRNTRVVDIVTQFIEYGVDVDVHDPWVNPDDLRKDHNLQLIEQPETGIYDCVVLAVAHDCFIDVGSDKLRRYGRRTHVFCDLKSVFESDESDLRL